MFGFRKKVTAQGFWEWFQKHEDEYYTLNATNEKALNRLGDQLQKVNPHLAFEFSADLTDGKREFIISADGELEAFPAVEELVEIAPLDPSKWIVIPFRQRQGVFAIDYEGVKVEPEKLSFTYEIEQDTIDPLIHLDIYVRDLPESDETIAATFILLDYMLGEYDVETKIGEINFSTFDPANDNTDPIEELVAIVDSI